METKEFKIQQSRDQLASEIKAERNKDPKSAYEKLQKEKNKLENIINASWCSFFKAKSGNDIERKISSVEFNNFEEFVKVGNEFCGTDEFKALVEYLKENNVTDVRGFASPGGVNFRYLGVNEGVIDASFHEQDLDDVNYVEHYPDATAIKISLLIKDKLQKGELMRISYGSDNRHLIHLQGQQSQERIDTIRKIIQNADTNIEFDSVSFPTKDFPVTTITFYT